VVTDFLGRYPYLPTRANRKAMLADYIRHAAITDLSELTEANVVAFCTANRPDGRPLANNTVYTRTSHLRSFVAWCVRHRYLDHDPLADLADRSHPLRQYRRSAGKLQSAHPVRDHGILPRLDH
jgi:site-specific recombinase XerC